MASNNHDELEAIRQLKARYFRLMDTQQWDAWKSCFTDDISAFYEGAPRVSPDAPTDIGCEGKQALGFASGRPDCCTALRYPQRIRTDLVLPDL